MSTNQTLKKRWLNIEELAKEYGFSKSSQYQLRKTKQIPFTQIKASSKTNKNNGSVRYDRYLIDEWLEANRVNKWGIEMIYIADEVELWLIH